METASKITDIRARAGLALAPKPWFGFWENKKINFQRVFGDGGGNFKKPGPPPDSEPGVLRLEPRRGNNEELVGFVVKVQSGDLKVVWDGVTLAPLGSRPATIAGGKLRPWVADDAHEIEYAKATNELVAALRKDDTSLQRLEGYFPVTDPNTGSFNVDRVRIVNIPNVVEDGSDLTLVVLTLLESHGLAAQQDGGGSGPPSSNS